MNKKQTYAQGPKVKLANGMEVPDTQESRFVLAWEKKTANKVWDSSVGKYGAWVEKK